MGHPIGGLRCNSIWSCWSLLLVWGNEGFQAGSWYLRCPWSLISCLILRLFSCVITTNQLSRMVLSGLWALLLMGNILPDFRLGLDGLGLLSSLRMARLRLVEFGWLHKLTFRPLNGSVSRCFISFCICLSLSHPNSLLRRSLLMAIGHEATKGLLLRYLLVRRLFV